MSSPYRFFGRERATVELEGSFRPEHLSVPPPLDLELDAEGRARVRLFAFHVDGLRIAGIPLVRSSYAELLWRVAVRTDQRPAWWVAACDLGARAPRWLAGRFVRYPVRAQEVAVGLDGVRSSGGAGTLGIALGADGRDGAAPEVRTLLSGPGAEWEVPWGDDGVPGRLVTATVDEDSLAAATLGSPVTWTTTALVRAGREHRCGVARARL